MTADADPALVFDEDRDKVWDDAWERRTQHSWLDVPKGRIEASGWRQMPESSVIEIDMVWIHGHLMLDHGALTAPRPFPGRRLTSPAYT